MTRLLKSSVFLILFIVLIFSYIVSFISSDVVLNDKIYGKYLDEQYQLKYAEYKALDLDLAEFEDELAQFDSSGVSEYDLDSFFIDSIFIIVPMLLVLIGYSCTLLILVLFHKTLQTIKYEAILKCCLVAYPIFYLPEMLSALYFLVYNTDYRFETIVEFQNLFYLKSLFGNGGTWAWATDILAETNYFYFIFPLVIALLLKLRYPQVKKLQLIGHTYLAYFIVFLFYNTIFWYLFDLI